MLNQVIQQLNRATKHSIAGLNATWQHELAFRIEVVMTPVLIICALWLGETTVEKVLLIAAWGLVLVVELINTAIESTIDRIGLERHSLSGQAKDQASAAVFVSVVMAIGVWLGILL